MEAEKLTIEITIEKASMTFSLEKLQGLLEMLVKILKKKKLATHIVVKEDPKGPDLEEGQMGKPFSNTDVRQIYLVPKNDQDKKDKIQAGTMVATSRDESVATIALFDFKADADLGEGVIEITGMYSCPIVDQAATIIDVEEGVDSPKAPTPTPHAAGSSSGKSKP